MSAASPALTRESSTAPEFELAVVMPCLNEAETLEVCIRKAQSAMRNAGINGEVIIADNGSTDGSQAIATSCGARLVNVPSKGYGAAIMGGIQAARSLYVVMADADDSYDFSHVDRFVERLRSGADLVMGNRFRGGVQPKAMPFLHRYLGNPVLTFIGRLFFKSNCGDFHCGMRGFSKLAYERMQLRTTGMEFASEMVVKATLLGLNVTEVPTTLSPDGRTRAPHLRTWRDGWRHLRFLLLYSPRWLFLAPGVLLMWAGLLTLGLLLPHARVIGRFHLDVHTMLYAANAVFVGYQLITFAVYTKVFAIAEGLLPQDKRMELLFEYVRLETGLIAGAFMTLAGLLLSGYAVWIWRLHGYQGLDYSSTMRLVIPAALAITLGFQTVFSSFFLSVLGMNRK